MYSIGSMTPAARQGGVGKAGEGWGRRVGVFGVLFAGLGAQ
jgi:hypothetical protein